MLDLENSNLSPAGLQAIARQFRDLRRLNLHGCFFASVTEAFAPLNFGSQFEQLQFISHISVNCDEISIQQQWDNGLQLHFIAQGLIRQNTTASILRARLLLDRVLTLMPNYKNAVLDYAHMLSTSYDTQPATPETVSKACDIYEKILKIYPDDYDVGCTLASLYIDEPAVQNLPRAAKLIKRLKPVCEFKVAYLERRLAELQKRAQIASIINFSD